MARKGLLPGPGGARRPPRTRTSPALTASWPSSTTPTLTRVPRSVSRRSRPPTRCIGDQAKRKEYDEVRTMSQHGFAGNPFAGGGAGLRRGPGFPTSGWTTWATSWATFSAAAGARAGRRPSAAAVGAQRGQDVEAELHLSFRRRRQGSDHDGQCDLGGSLFHLRGLGRRPGHGAHGLPGVRGPGRGQREPGDVLLQPPVRGLWRHGHADRGAVPDLWRPRDGKARPPGQGAHPPRGRGRAADPGPGPGRGRAATGAPQATFTSSSTSPPTRSSARKART